MERDFERLVEPHRRELLAHCYRMLGSPQDAEDALQDALLDAWRGLEGFAGRSSVRTWLYRVTTNACLRHRERRMTTPDRFAPLEDPTDLGEMVPGPVWLEPLAEDAYGIREDVELAWVAALQHLPPNQRAVLLLRDVLEFSAAETAQALETSVASANSALQRARAAVAERVPPVSQADELAALGDDGVRALVERFLTAWEAADVDGLLHLLTEDVRFTMPPLPAWFGGRAAVRRFLAERMFETTWRLRPTRANGQLSFVCSGGGELLAVNVVSVRDGRVSAIDAFLDRAVIARFDR